MVRVKRNAQGEHTPALGLVFLGGEGRAGEGAGTNPIPLRGTGGDRRREYPLL